MKKILLIILLLLIMPTVMAAKGHMTLLAVKETTKGYKGSTADLYLEIVPGTGRVFLETFPLSKLDTQISTRFAKEIACNYLDENCDQYDFFYTIEADSAIIGGPSAGAATAVLTATVLEGEKIDETIAMTGTINSGGLIGPVSGLKAKIEAAADKNMTKVIIPKGERKETDKKLNLTYDLIEYGEEIGIKVEEAGDLTQALYGFTGKKYKEITGELEIDKEYEKRMKIIAIQLRNRTILLQKLITGRKLNENQTKMLKKAMNFTNKSKNSYNKKQYYTSASYAYAANVHYRQILIEKGYKEKIDIEPLNNKTEKQQIKTISDLEAYSIVKERLKDAEDLLTKDNTSRNLARATERVYSAETWSEFFGMKSKEIEFNKEIIKKGCLKKLAEAEERYQYTKTFFPDLKETRQELLYAYEDMENKDYELCLFKASKAKAEVGVILSVIGVGEEQVESLLENKLAVVKRQLIEQQQKGIFPILGYSYYEYANNLDDRYSKLLYSEYALELSNLDLYFKEKESKKIRIQIPYDMILLFLGGMFFGITITLTYTKIKKNKTHAKHPKTRLRGKKR